LWLYFYLKRHSALRDAIKEWLDAVVMRDACGKRQADMRIQNRIVCCR